MNKREKGQYFTENNPFVLTPFKEWFNKYNLLNCKILEPFAGSNNLIKMLNSSNFASYDIEPKDVNVEQRDTLLDFPKGFNLCITNPPYLAKNIAKRKKFTFPDTIFDDLYKECLDKCLKNCDFIAIIIPASFINSTFIKSRLEYYILLTEFMFKDTDHPVCLALFSKNQVDETKIYENNTYLGTLGDLKKHLLTDSKRYNVKFNDPQGNLGLIAIDNCINNSIKFCKAESLDKYSIKNSSRSITKILIPEITEINTLINLLNEELNNYRKITSDIFLTPFKGLRKDGKYRRRLDFNTAKKIINKIVDNHF